MQPCTSSFVFLIFWRIDVIFFNIGTFYVFKWLFVWKRERCPLYWFAAGPGQTRARSQTSVLVSLVDGRDPISGAIVCCIPWSYNEMGVQLGLEPKHSDMGYRHNRCINQKQNSCYLPCSLHPPLKFKGEEREKRGLLGNTSSSSPLKPLTARAGPGAHLKHLSHHLCARAWISMDLESVPEVGIEQRDSWDGNCPNCQTRYLPHKHSSELWLG